MPAVRRNITPLSRWAPWPITRIIAAMSPAYWSRLYATTTPSSRTPAYSMYGPVS